MKERDEPVRAEPVREGREPGPRAGLCPRCVHVRRVDSAVGSTFWLCQRSKREPQFPRYPPQPRMECSGFES